MEVKQICIGRTWLHDEIAPAKTAPAQPSLRGGGGFDTGGCPQKYFLAADFLDLS